MWHCLGRTTYPDALSLARLDGIKSQYRLTKTANVSVPSASAPSQPLHRASPTTTTTTPLLCMCLSPLGTLETLNSSSSRLVFPFTTLEPAFPWVAITPHRCCSHTLSSIIASHLPTFRLAEIPGVRVTPHTYLARSAALHHTTTTSPANRLDLLTFHVDLDISRASYSTGH